MTKNPCTLPLTMTADTVSINGEYVPSDVQKLWKYIAYRLYGAKPS